MANQSVSIVDIAREAGVSAATVSRVLNGSARVDPEKVKRVLTVSRAHNFTLNSASKGGPAKAVGVLIPTLRDEFFGTIVTGIENRLQQAGLQMMCSLGHENGSDETMALEGLLERKLDGLILFADWLPDTLLLEVVRRKIPLVLMNRSLPELAPHCVRLDNIHGGYLATRHLLDLGHTRIAHITGSLDRLDARERYAGYREALREAGIAPIEALELMSSEVWLEEHEGGKAAVGRLLKRTEFTAVFAANDWLALGAVEGLLEVGLNVPGDVSVVGFDNRRLTGFCAPPLTVMDYPRLKMGQLAADHLLALISGKDIGALPLLQPNLVLRQSTAPPRKIQNV